MTEKTARTRARSAGMVVGLLINIVGPILVFGQKKHSTEFMMGIGDALPWGAGLALAGALIALWSCWTLPRRATEGPALGIIMLAVTGAGLIVSIPRLAGTEIGAAELLSIAGFVVAIAVLVLSTVQCARKPEDTRRRGTAGRRR